MALVSLGLAEGAVDCSTDGTKCESCSTMVLCSGGNPTPLACQTGEMCEEAGGTASCLLASDTSRTQCQCSTFPSYVPDSYDTQKYLLCFSPTMQLSLSCPAGEEFDETAGRCEALPPTTVITTTTVQTTTEPSVTCTEEGLFPLLPDCKGYYGCYSVASTLISTGVVFCESPKVYNPDTLSCVDSIEGPATPTCGSTDIVVADTLECNAFYVCSSGTILGEKICCAEGQVFNPDISGCEADSGSVTCPSENPCFTGEVTKKCLPPSC